MQWLLFLLALSGPVFGDALDGGYRLGSGYAVGDSGLRLGGYASLKHIDLVPAPTKLEISDLSLFLIWDGGGRWQAFSEMEIGEAAIWTRDTGLSAEDAEFELERTYLDYLYSPELKIRLGKFLTPIGYWNQVHADPLTWTVSRPLTTDEGFAHHLTGLMLHGEWLFENHELGYQLYVDDSVRLDPKPDNPSPAGRDLPGIEIGAFDRAVGGRLLLKSVDADWQLGGSLVNFGIEGVEGRRTLVGLDFLWRHGGHEWSGEAIYRFDAEDRDNSEWGAFLQGIVPLHAGWSLVLRQERYVEQAFDRPIDLSNVGLAWRPIPPLVFKLERRWGTGNELFAPDGGFASVAVLF
jgi:hypothetical protein